MRPCFLTPLLTFCRKYAVFLQKINAVMVTLRSIHDPSIAPLAAASGVLRVAWRC